MKHSRKGFRARPIYRFKQPNLLAYASRRLSFVIAVLSIVAFIAGNTLGYLGWQGMWKTAFGMEDDSLIVFTGMVPPIEKVPDYRRWSSQYGGNPSANLFSQVPQDLLVSLPTYNTQDVGDRGPTDPKTVSLGHLVYSVDFLGSYNTGVYDSGSHNGMDIRVPVGTPVVAVANAIVEHVVSQEYGFGHYITLRIPNVPDTANPGKTITVYATYGHLSDILVSEGQTVRKGQQIATSGQTGFATGPHLHFQVDKATAAYIPFFPFTAAEQNAAGMTLIQAINAGLNKDRGHLYSLHPMLLVQQFESFDSSAVARTLRTSDSVTQAKVLSPAALRQQRISVRVARANLRSKTVNALALATPEEMAAVQSSASSSSAAPVVIPISAVSSSSSMASSVATSSPVVRQSVRQIVLRAQQTYVRGKQELKVYAVDENGETVTNPVFVGSFTLTTVFGEAQFTPTKLYQSDFVNGIAKVQWIPGAGNGKKTIIINAVGGPLPVQTSGPIKAVN